MFLGDKQEIAPVITVINSLSHMSMAHMIHPLFDFGGSQCDNCYIIGQLCFMHAVQMLPQFTFHCMILPLKVTVHFSYDCSIRKFDNTFSRNGMAMAYSIHHTCKWSSCMEQSFL